MNSIPIFVVAAYGALTSWYTASVGTPTAWAGHPFDPAKHICARPINAEAFGTRFDLVNEDNGKRSWCIVGDRGPFIPGRTLDVSPAVRDELGFTGLASVTIYRFDGEIRPCRRAPRPIKCAAPPKPCALPFFPKAILVCG